MAAKIFGPRKQRTRQHVIADQSVHHVEGFILDEGHTAQRVYSDYGYDLVMSTFDEQGFVEAGLVFLQIKASEKLHETEGVYSFDLDIRDYNLWMSEQVPLILVLYDSSRQRAYWLAVKDFFLEEIDRQPTKNARTIRVKVPSEQRVNRRAVAKWRLLKQAAIK
jgi:Domain of unknown function (DUF4365)